MSGTEQPPKLGAEPSLSVIIPYYRAADTIREAVESALAQIVPPDEIVICDDGSPDDLETALGALRERVTIVSQPNGGFSSAMNTATRAARGEFVVQLDADDAFLPNRLAAIRRAAAASPDADIIATDALIECDGHVVGLVSDAWRFETRDQRMAILRGAPFFAWPAMRRSQLLAVGGFDGAFKTVADYDCFVRLILGGSRAVFVDEPLYRYRIGSGSLLSDVANMSSEAALILAKALRRDDLSPAERQFAEASMAAARRTSAVQQARNALVLDEPGARKQLRDVLFGRDYSPISRAKAATALLLPGLARRAIARSATRRETPTGAFRERFGARPRGVGGA